jgi:hypothetical protein
LVVLTTTGNILFAHPFSIILSSYTIGIVQMGGIMLVADWILLRLDDAFRVWIRMSV